MADMTPGGRLKRKLKGQVKRYAQARVKHSWMGGKPPEEWEEVLEELESAKIALYKTIDEVGDLVDQAARAARS